jgi:hypothetical protein
LVATRLLEAISSVSLLAASISKVLGATPNAELSPPTAREPEMQPQ